MGEPNSVASHHSGLARPTFVGPASFQHFDNIPEVFALALGEGGTYIWQNRCLRDHLRAVFGRCDAPSIYEYLEPAHADERLNALQPALDEGQPVTYFELLAGVRRRTRVWPLDPAEFGKHGWFLVISPELHRAKDADELRTLQGGVLGDLSVLTARELVVLRRTAEGLSASEVAKSEYRSVKTIENQLQAIHAKLGLANRAELVRFACEHGILAFTAEEWSSIVEHSAPGARVRHVTLEPATDDARPAMNPPA